MELIVWSAAFCVSLFFLMRGADEFLVGAEAIGMGFGLSPFIVGVMIVAMGTSFPELVSSLAAAWMGPSEIVLGTVVGSNVTNILLILSVAALIGGGLKVAHELVKVDLPFLFGSALLLTICSLDGVVGRIEAVLCLIGLATYLVYAATSDRERGEPAHPVVARVATPLASWLRAGIAAVVLQAAAYVTVLSLTRIADQVGVADDVLAASVLALGTSLPELMVTVRAARGGKPEIAVGNVLGSNVFNALGVVGMSGLVAPLAVTESLRSFALPVMVGVTILCFFVLQEREMTPWDGWLLGLLYVVFVGHLYQLL